MFYYGVSRAIYFLATDKTNGNPVTSGVVAKVSKDGATAVASTNTPTFVSGCTWQLVLTAAEMTAQSIAVMPEHVSISGIPTIISTARDYRLLSGVLPDQTGMATNQIKVATDGSAATDAYKGNSLVVHSATGRFALSIIAYNGTTKVATLATNKPINPSSGDYYHIVPDGKIAMTATDVQASIFGYQMDGLEFSSLIKIMASVLAGKMAIDVDGVTVRYRDLPDTKNRVVATTTTDGQRTAVTRDGS